MVAERSINILVVDGNDDFLNSMVKYFLCHNHDITCVKGGDKAVKMMRKDPKHFDLVVLDWVESNIHDGDVLRAINSNPELQHIPVVMQSAKNGIIDKCELRIKTLENAKATAVYLSKLYPDPETSVMGIYELIVNAVEHGNLDIGYMRKSELIENGIWALEIEQRLNLSKNQLKKVEVQFLKNEEDIKLFIKDEGKGFNWKKYLDISSERATDKHGRGIALSNLLSFDELRYLGKGNEVCCVVTLA